MVGGHLDSWASATGATDNGAGTVVAMEVMRILNSLQVKPRRTIRVGLWTGEEEGEFGSFGYVKQHFGFVPRSTDPDQINITEFDRDPSGPIQLKPDHKKLSVYFNVDNGSGKIRGIYLQGNAAVATIFQQWMAPLEDLGVNTLTIAIPAAPITKPSTPSAFPAFNSSRIRSTTARALIIRTWTLTSAFNPKTSRKPPLVEATFVYNAAMRDQMLPRKPLPHPELEQKRTQPLKKVMPGAEEKQ